MCRLGFFDLSRQLPHLNSSPLRTTLTSAHPMLMSISAALYGDFLVFFLRFHLFIFRGGEEKKEEKKRNISVKEKHKSVPSHTHPDWGLKHNPGM